MNVDFNAITPELVDYLKAFVSEERLERFEEVLNQRTRHMTVVLENISDDHNTNAVLRSCECFGVQDIHIIDNGSRFKPAKKVMRGSHKWITLHKYKDEPDNTRLCINKLREKGYRIIATTPHTNDLPVAEVPVDQPFALFFGQEKEGISDILREEADGFTIIPMQGFTESFNLSVAAGIMLYDLTRRLRETDVDWHLTEAEKFELRKRWIIKSIYRPDLIIDRYKQEHTHAG